MQSELDYHFDPSIFLKSLMHCSREAMNKVPPFCHGAGGGKKILWDTVPRSALSPGPAAQPAMNSWLEVVPPSPDHMGGSTNTWAAIIEEFERLFKLPKRPHKR